MWKEVYNINHQIRSATWWLLEKNRERERRGSYIGGEIKLYAKFGRNIWVRVSFHYSFSFFLSFLSNSVLISTHIHIDTNMCLMPFLCTIFSF